MLLEFVETEIVVSCRLHLAASELKTLRWLHTKAEIRKEKVGGSVLNFTSEKRYFHLHRTQLLRSRHLSRVSAVPKI